MKKIICYFMIVSLLVFGMARFSEAGEPKKLAQATMSFLNIGVGARAVGMGESFICMDDDASAIFWNPAGIAKISGSALSLNHNQWIADMTQYGIAAAHNIPSLGTFGVSFLYMDNGQMDQTIPSTSETGYEVLGQFSVNQFAAGLAYAKEITDKFSIGGQVKYASQDLGNADILIQTEEESKTLLNQENKESTIALDFGTIYYTGFKDLRVAMSFRNFARSVKYAYESYELPLTFKVGIAMNVLSVLAPEMNSHSLQVAVDAVQPRDYTERIHLGVEYNFNNLLAIRGGYKFNYDEESFSAGFGLTPNISGVNLKLDYAYTAFGEMFGSVQRISFGFAF